MQSKKDWNFQDGKEQYSRQLMTEILAVSIDISQGRLLEKDQLSLVKYIFDSLYENYRLAIVRPKGRQKGITMPDISIRVYEIMKAVEETGIHVTKAIENVANNNGIGFETMRAHYYEIQKNENLNNPKSKSRFFLTMKYASEVYLKK